MGNENEICIVSDSVKIGRIWKKWECNSSRVLLLYYDDGDLIVFWRENVNFNRKVNV